MENNFSRVKLENKVIEIDTFLRRRIAGVRIPYWENGKPAVASLKNELRESKIGSSINSIEEIKHKGIVRGLAVTYTVRNSEYVTKALFSSIPVMNKGL